MKDRAPWWAYWIVTFAAAGVWWLLMLGMEQMDAGWSPSFPYDIEAPSESMDPIMMVGAVGIIVLLCMSIGRTISAFFNAVIKMK